MKTIKATIGRAGDGFFSVYCERYPFWGGGDSAEAAKADMLCQMEIYKSECVESGEKYPAILDGEYEIIYAYDVCAMLNYYSGILSLSGLEKITGINQKQLWKYLHGKATPRRAQVDKISSGLQSFAAELQSVIL